MANLLLTIDDIARESAYVFVESCVGFPLMRSRRHEAFFTEGTQAKGKTIRIRDHEVLDVDEFDGVTPIAISDISESEIPLTISKHFSKKVKLTAENAGLELTDFSRQVIMPVMTGFARKLGAFAAELLNEVPNFVGTAGTPPSSWDDLVDAQTALNQQLAPMENRRGLLSASTDGAVRKIPEVQHANLRGDGGASMQAAEIGFTGGIGWYMDQSLDSTVNHTPGAIRADAPAVNGAVAEGATTMAIDGGTGTNGVKRGDLFTVAGATGFQGVFTADAAGVGGAIASASFSPPAPAGGFANDALITIQAAHQKNVVFAEGAFAIVTIPTVGSMNNGESAQYSDPRTGAAVTVTTGFDMSLQSNVLLFEMLVGGRFIKPGMATILLA